MSAMFFTDEEHRMILASIAREKAHLLENPEFKSLINVLNNIERKISRLQHRKGPWVDVKDSKKPQDREQVIVRLGNDSYCLANYAKDLYKVDKYDFYQERGKAGFYCYDTEVGYYPLDGVVKWMKIPLEVEFQ